MIAEVVMIISRELFQAWILKNKIEQSSAMKLILHSSCPLFPPQKKCCAVCQLTQYSL